MPPFANPLRHIWGRTQAPVHPGPDLMSSLDGMSDAGFHGQGMHETAVQQNVDGCTPTVHQNAPATTRQDRGGVETGCEMATPQFSQPPQQPTAESFQRAEQQPKQEEQGLGDWEQQQYDNTTLQQHLRTATDQHIETPAQFPSAIRHEQAHALPASAANANAQVLVKCEPTFEGDADNELFAEFTNQDEHDDDDVCVGMEHDQAVNGTVVSKTTMDATLVKREPGVDEHLQVGRTEPTGSLGSITTSSHHNLHGRSCGLATADTAARSDTDKHTFGEPSTTATPLVRDTYSPVRQGNDVCIPPSQYVLNPRQSEVSPQTAQALVNDKSQQSPSADSAIGYQRQTSEEATPSPGNIKLPVNANLLAQREQWKRHQQLLGNNSLTVEAVRANPSLLHHPMPAQQQQGCGVSYPGSTDRLSHRTSNAFQDDNMQANAPYLSYPSYVSGEQMRAVHEQYMQYPNYPACVPHDKALPRQIHPLAGYLPGLSMHAPPGSAPYSHHLSQTSTIPRRITEVKEEQSKAFDDDEPLATRAPRHRSVTASRDSLSPSHATSGQDHGMATDKTSHMPSTDGKNAAITISDDEDPDDSIEPISWKLPDHEVSYQPSTADNDMPSAKVSLPGLVREEILLAPDHADQEAQLFQHIFLPAHQALPTPDPAPAHAVLNFHTIAVLVLEAFTQFELGDELGRDYQNQNRASPPPSRSATDANVDDIFFAVIDRWRAGLESGKQPLKLIRGCQEFCDVALDVIYYVKEHGLLKAQPKKRKERSDKGTVRGPRGGEVVKAGVKRKADVEGEGKGKGKGVKRGKVNEMQGRKKGKVEAKKGKSGVTVVNARKKE